MDLEWDRLALVVALPVQGKWAAGLRTSERWVQIELVVVKSVSSSRVSSVSWLVTLAALGPVAKSKDL